MNPPANAGGCVDEKTQIQALDRTAPILPLRPGMTEKQTHDYRRNGTTSLFAALEVATGKVTDACYDRHTNAEFLALLTLVAKAHPVRDLHVVCDNYATHKHPNVTAWLARNPRITLHFTPTSGSWLNLVEIFFGIITRQASAAAPSTPPVTSRPRSRHSSTAGTTAANRSSGPKTPTPSWPKPNVNELRTRDTRCRSGTTRRQASDRDTGSDRYLRVLT